MKTQHPDVTTHCQICGRPIKLVTGKIAHHGYKRPGVGWQTASCQGARQLPYETSRDYIPVVIENVTKQQTAMKQRLATIQVQPPESYTWYKGAWEHQPIVVARPVELDMIRMVNRFHTYEALYSADMRRLEAEIADMGRFIDYLKNRYNVWKPAR